MAGETQLLPHGGRAVVERPTMYAEVSTLQPAPGSFTDPLFIVFPHDPDHAIRIENWPAIHGATMPALGARVMVAVDEQHNYAVIDWDGVYS